MDNAFILCATHHRSNGGNAFLFNFYTACRPAMVRFATWEMVNLEDKVIRFPASLMKEDLDFHLPLNAGAIAALVAQGVKKTGPCFPGQRGGVMSDATVNKWIKNAAKDVGVAAFTCHGSRTTFTNWRKRTRQHPDASEFLLAHAVQGIDKHYTEQRGPEDELWEPMVEVSDAWAYALDVAAAEAALA